MAPKIVSNIQDGGMIYFKGKTKTRRILNNIKSVDITKEEKKEGVRKSGKDIYMYVCTRREIHINSV